MYNSFWDLPLGTDLINQIKSLPGGSLKQLYTLVLKKFEVYVSKTGNNQISFRDFFISYCP